MGKAARAIAGKDVDKVIDALNKALADEWLAYMQYWFAEKLVNETYIRETLEDVAKEELEHATELTERIIQLGESPSRTRRNSIRRPTAATPSLRKTPRRS